MLIEKCTHVLNGLESDQPPFRQDTVSGTRNASVSHLSSPSVSRDTLTHSPHSGSHDPGSVNTKSHFGSAAGSGSCNKVHVQEDLAFGSSAACKAQQSFCTGCEYAGYILWTPSGRVVEFLDVLLHSKKPQLDSYLPHGDTDSLLIFPVRNAVPGENKPWDQVTGNERTAPRRRANAPKISQQAQNHARTSATHAAGPRTGYGWGSIHAPLDPNLVTSLESPQSPATDSMHSDMSFNPEFRMGFQAAEDMRNSSLDTPWVLPQQTSTIGAMQSTFNPIPHDSVPTIVPWVPCGPPGLLGPGMQTSATGNNSQDYHGGNDVLVPDFGIDLSQATFGEDPSAFLPNHQDSLPNLEFHDDRQGAEIWMMTTSPPVINILNFSTTDTGSSSMSDMSSDFERQLTTVQVSPSIQSQGSNGSVTSTMIPEGSLWEDNGVGFERSDIGEYGLGAGEES
jgi:hypothetical protein